MDHGTEQEIKGGIITKVERQKRVRDRYNLFIDEQYAFSVHEDILIKYRLVKGAAIDQDELRSIVQAQEKQQAYLYAVRLLSSRLRSEQELLHRLKHKGYDSALSIATVERLKKEQYVDDAIFAEQLTKQRIRSQKKGRNWVKQELQHKGILPEQISHALQQIDEDVEYRSAYSLIDKKYRKEFNNDPQQARRKAMGFLLRRGYSPSLVTKVIREITRSNGEETDEWTDSEFE